MNREILRIAIPNIISNITVPLMGMVSTAIAGRSGFNSAITIGELAIGVSVFNMIYWNCNFIRMGTSGITAQAYGAEEFDKTTQILIRSLAIAFIMGLLLLVLRNPISHFAIDFMNGGEMSLAYVRARFWAIPAGVMLFAMHGWFTGMQNGTHSMVVALSVNIIHICTSLYLALHCQLGIVGIAYASIVAQWSGVVIALSILYLKYRHHLRAVSRKELLQRRSITEFFCVNSNIFVRTLCIVAVYTYFTRASSHMGDATIFAVNVLLMQLFTLYSYISDGFAYAAEALVGRFTGAHSIAQLRRAVVLSLKWGLVVALLFVAIYIIWWRDILSLFLGNSSNVNDVLAVAHQYIGWIIFIPLAGILPVVIDGIMVGAGFTGVMRNSMVISAAIFFATYYALHPVLHNDALWMAFTIFISLRGLLQYYMTNRLRRVFENQI